MNQSCQEFLLVVMQLSKGKMRKNNVKKPVSKTKNRRPDFRFPINISIVWLHKICWSVQWECKGCVRTGRIFPNPNMWQHFTGPDCHQNAKAPSHHSHS